MAHKTGIKRRQVAGFSAAKTQFFSELRL
eukprot:COSAG03_NODE_3027_length_2279_cov_33.155505_3_plen_28_part_01